MTATVALLLALSLAAGPTAAEKPRPGCDVSVEFNARKGEIDTRAYQRIKAWLEQTKELSSFEEAPPRRDGRETFCLHTKSKDSIRPVFTAVSLLVDRNFGGKAPVKVTNRFGGLFERKPYRYWAPYPSPPRNNGISERPPLGNRN